jgi:hypothetical protein
MNLLCSKRHSTPAAALLLSALAAAQSGLMVRVSVDSGGGEGNDDSISAGLSSDARHVGFWSEASNLVAGDSNGALDVFVHDRMTGLTELGSITSSGGQPNGGSYGGGLSGDGRFVRKVRAVRHERDQRRSR